MSSPPSPWETHASRTVYENPWIVVREDEVTRPDGGRGVYGVPALRHEAVFVVPVTEAGEVVLVRLFRYPVGRWSWEIPAGGSEEGACPEQLLVAARRELLEEAGLEAATWTPLGEVFSLNGLAEAPGHVFLARGLSDPSGGPGLTGDQREEGITDVRRVAWADLPALARAGDLTDGETLAALQLARWHLDAQL